MESIHGQRNIYPFLSRIMNVRYNDGSPHGLLMYIHYYIDNDDNLRIKDDKKSYNVVDKLELLFIECKFIASKRGKNIIIPKVMKKSETFKLIQYCFVRNPDTDTYFSMPFNVLTEEEVSIHKKFFIETIFEELESVVYSPDRISY